MNPKVLAAPSWSTASYGDAADTSPMELSALGHHLQACRGAAGRWFSLQCAAESLHAMASGRLVTTVAVVAVVMGFGALAALVM